MALPPVGTQRIIENVVDLLSANSDVPYRATLAEAVATLPASTPAAPIYFKTDDKDGVGPHPGELWIYQRTAVAPFYDAMIAGNASVIDIDVALAEATALLTQTQAAATDALDAGGQIRKATWSELSVAAGTDGQIGVSLATSGTHASLAGDVGASGGQTPNGGEFRYTEGVGWVRIGATSSLQAQAAVASISGMVGAGKNLANPADADVQMGFTLNTSNGAATANAAYNLTGFIPVKAEDTFTASSSGNRAFYNASKVFVAGTGSTGATIPLTFTAPAGAVYVRYAGLASAWSTFQIERGPLATSYQAYQTAITPEKLNVPTGTLSVTQTNFYAVGKNLFDASAATAGFAVSGSSGALTANVNYHASGYIPVTVGTTYAMSDRRQYAFYDASRAYVSGSTSSTGGTGTLTVPAGAAFVRLSIINTAYATFQFEVGTASTAYKPFRYVISTEVVPPLTGDQMRPASVPGSVLTDAAVTPQKTSFMALGKNLFNKALVTAGSYILGSSGVPTANAAYSYTNYIPVTAGATYALSHERQYAWYDATQAYISGSTSVVTGGPVLITAPVGAAFLRLSILNTTIDAVQLEAGSTFTDYEPYGYKVGLSYLPSGSGGASVEPTPGNFRAKALREFRQRATLREFEENARIIHAAIGDSYTDNRDRYTAPLHSRIIGKKNDNGVALGDGGGGWVGFGDLSVNAGTFNHGNVRTAYSYSRTGTWTTDALFYTGGGVDLGAIQSTSAGARITLGLPATPIHTTATLVWSNTADGVVRYSWDAGSSWTSLNVQGGTVDDLNSATLAGIPSGAGTLWIEVVSGTVKLHGLNWVSAANGYVMHKLGASGSTAAQWAARADTAKWRAGLALLAPNTVSVMLGTNDNNLNTAKSTFKGYIQRIVDGIRAAAPAADIWLIAVAQTPRVLTVPMSDYARAMYEIARDSSNGITFTWLQDAFGDPTSPTQYAHNGIRPWFTDDGGEGSADNDIHPAPPSGGRAMVGDLYKSLFFYP